MVFALSGVSLLSCDTPENKLERKVRSMKWDVSSSEDFESRVRDLEDKVSNLEYKLRKGI